MGPSVEMMPRLLLALETSGTTGGAALLAEGRLVGSVAFTSATLYSQRLLPSVEWLLERTGLPIEQVDAVAVSRGPGSFTGLRIGMSAAKGIAYSNGALLVSVSTLEAMALRAAQFEGQLVCPLMDARQGQVYAGLFKVGQTFLSVGPEKVGQTFLSVSPAASDGANEGLGATKGLNESGMPQLVRLQEDYAGPLEAITGWAGDSRITFCGEGAVKFAGRLVELLGERAAFAPGIRINPSAEEVGWLGLQRLVSGEQDDLMLLEPDYLRRSYMEK